MARMRRLLPEPSDEVDLETAYSLRPRTGSHLRVNFVASVDGVVTVGGVSGPLSSPDDHRVFSLLRGLADVVLVGAGTTRLEGYGPARPTAERREIRERLGKDPIPRIAVVTSRLALDLASPFFTEAKVRPLVFTTEQAPPDLRAAASEHADVVVAGESVADLGLVVDELADRGLPHVLCEGGPRLFTELLAADRVDEMCLTVAPVVVAGAGRRLTDQLSLPEPQRFSVGQLLQADDGYLFFRYFRDKAAPPPTS